MTLFSQSFTLVCIPPRSQVCKYIVIVIVTLYCLFVTLLLSSCLRIYIVIKYIRIAIIEKIDTMLMSGCNTFNISIVINIVVNTIGMNTFNSFRKSIVICRNLMYDIVSIYLLHIYYPNAIVLS